jgi:predicted TPR repeat methyltransferase
MDSQQLPQGEEKVRAVRSMFDAIAPRYDLVNRVMTFRMDVAWRTRTVRELGLPNGSLVADLACGTGDFCRELQKQGLRPIGFDLSFGMLAAAMGSSLSLLEQFDPVDASPFSKLPSRRIASSAGATRSTSVPSFPRWVAFFPILRPTSTYRNRWRIFPNLV